MKKIMLGLVAVGLLAFSSCDFFQTIIESFFGNASLTLVKEEGSQSQEFTSCVSSTMILPNEEGDSTLSTLFLAACINLTEENATVDFPYLGINLTDSVAGDYDLASFSLSFFADSNLKGEDMLQNFKGQNVLVYVPNDSTWYLSNGGTVTLNNFAIIGKETSGSFTIDGNLLEMNIASILQAINWVANYTAERTAELVAAGTSDEEEIRSIIQAEIDGTPLTTCFHAVSLTGSFSSLRLGEDITNMFAN